MSERPILVAAFGDAGHAFPAIALARALQRSGHPVEVETWGRWREAVEAEGLSFRAAERYQVYPPPPPGSESGPAQAARALLPLLEELRPRLVVSDVLTLAPTLAAELFGCRHATLVPHLYPVHQPRQPFFSFGMMPARTPLGRGLWRAAQPLLESGLRRGRGELNETRATLGLPPVDRFHGGMSEQLVLVSTYEALEYPRRWPEHVRICGPLSFELPHPDVELPEGPEPLVLIAPSTAHDPDSELVRDCLAAYASEPVRVLATLNGQRPERPIEVPENARLVDWLSYSQAMPAADVVVCHGGHGTVCRAIEAGKPLLVSPAIGDMAENGARVQWAGAGLMLPSRLRLRRSLRWVLRELLAEPRYGKQSRQIAAESPPEAAGLRAVEAIEELLAAD